MDIKDIEKMKEDLVDAKINIEVKEEKKEVILLI